MAKSIMVVGASGQIGTELVQTFRDAYGADRVVATDIRDQPTEVLEHGPYEKLDILDGKRLYELVKKYDVAEVYHLAALLSATAEKEPALGWKLNMDGLFNVLNLGRDGHIRRIFWPSSIAVFGPNTPKDFTPQRTIMEPTTVYGISKVAGESWCEYYHRRYEVDVRSVRFPGIIGYKSPPGGGTTDYAVHIFYEALKKKTYGCFLGADAELPMMYMPDAIKAVVEIMAAPAENLTIRTSYNIADMSFTPAVIAEAIRQRIPDFKITYAPDYRDNIAKSWPSSIDDRHARKDWGWEPDYTLEDVVVDMLKHVAAKTEL